ncbi:MAG: hypothetical protein ABSC23_09555 [Bryobacteraceae bacterium]|jgi:hypothetical protein
MQDPVVSLYGRARLAALVCQLDKAAGSKMFREAWTDLKSLSDDAFDASKTPLPVATFSAMWALVIPPAKACDRDVPWDDNRLLERRDAEGRNKANLWLNKALNTADPHRVAQLAEAAISLGWGGGGLGEGPGRWPDLNLLVDVLTKLAKVTPDLSDAIFQKVTDGPPFRYTYGAFQLELVARYLFPTTASARLEIIPFLPPEPRGWPVKLPIFTRAPLRASLDLLKRFLTSAVYAVEMPEAPMFDLAGRYTLAYQMLPKARLYAPEYAKAFEDFLPVLEAQTQSFAAANRALIGPIPEASPDAPAQREEFLAVAEELSEIRASQYVAARNHLSSLGDTPLRHQLEALIDFGEAAESLPGRDAERVLKQPIYPEPGARRALLYASIAAAARPQESAFEALAMAYQDIEPLPSAQRVCLLTGLAGIALPKSPDVALGFFKQAIEAENGAAALAAASTGSFLRSDACCERDGLVEALDTKEGRQAILLHAPGISTYTINGFVAEAKGLDLSQLESAVQRLRDPTRLAEALVAVAELRLQAGRH